MINFIAEKPFNWSVQFKPVEQTVNPHIVSVADSVQWYVYMIAGMGGIFLFILSGNRKRKGDTLGAFISFMGAIIFSAAPYLAKKFL